MAEKIFDRQINFGWGLSFNMTGKAPAVAKRIFDTYNDALAYANDVNDSAIEGLVLSVVADTDEIKNGLYFVKQIATPAIEADEEKGIEAVDAKSAILIKLSTNADSQATADEVYNALTAYTATTKVTLDNIDSDITDIKADVTGITADITGIKADITGITEDVTGIKADITGITEDITGITADITGITADITDIKEDITGITADITGITADITDIKADITGITEDVTDIYAKLDENDQAHQTLDNKITTGLTNANSAIAAIKSAYVNAAEGEGNVKTELVADADGNGKTLKVTLEWQEF